MTTDDNFTDSDKVSPSEVKAIDTPKCRHARARQEDSASPWHITLCYDHLPLGSHISITTEYMGDYFLPVVWDTTPYDKLEQEAVAYQISEVALNGVFTTAYYKTEEDHAIYFINEQGEESMIAVASESGDAGEIAHAMNATFPAGDTKAYHEAERAKARQHFATFRIGRDG